MDIWKMGFLGLLVIAGTGMVMAGFGGQMLEDLDPEQQELMEQMHQARLDGDTEALEALEAQAEELGIPCGPEGMGPGGRGGMRGMKGADGFGPGGPMMDPEQHEALVAAIESSDWDAYSALVDEYGFENGIHSRMTEEAFPRLVEIHEKQTELRGLMDGLAEDLGIEKPGGFGRGFGGA